jgi:hypothetical protein
MENMFNKILYTERSMQKVREYNLQDEVRVLLFQFEDSPSLFFNQATEVGVSFFSKFKKPGKGYAYKLKDKRLVFFFSSDEKILFLVDVMEKV